MKNLTHILLKHKCQLLLLELVYTHQIILQFNIVIDISVNWSNAIDV